MKALEVCAGVSKVFVTGVFGTGKTKLARAASAAHKLPYRSFDQDWNYKNQSVEQARFHFASLPERFVVDAIAYHAPPDPYAEFHKYYEAHRDDVVVLCTTCLDLDAWARRLTKKKYAPRPAKARSDFLAFHTQNIPMLSGNNLFIYDTERDQMVSAQEVAAFIEGVS